MKSIGLIARVIVIAIVAMFILRFVASAQPPPQQDMPLDAATRTAVVNSLSKELVESYVFADVANRMENEIKSRMLSREYDALTSSIAFAQRLTTDLQSISKDKHLRVRYSFRPLPARQDRREPNAAEIERFRAQNKRINYGFERVERLNGNIGYIDLRGFNNPEAGAETVAAAMMFLSNTDALIFDLRQNGGGDPAMVALISSYLFGDKPVHLNNLYWRKGDQTNEFWTKPASARIKLPDKDVYVLTSNYTFSGAEEFSYNLKNLKRATIVGETTGGGAHPGGMVRLHDHFAAFIPTGRAINPISKTNWEGTGVEPDVKVSKELALKTAYLMALTKSVERLNDDELKTGLQQLIQQTKKEIDELKVKK